jgi:DNA helicase-2/ATP-dependent DNA helicase PcrA
MALNPSQQQAVTHPGGPMLVLAGAGAGKTSVLTQRIAHLVSKRGILPSRILVVTFTNKAAKEMKERLAKLLGKEIVKEIWAGTFHSICCRILRQDIGQLGTGHQTNFAIYDPRDQEKAMDFTLRRMNMDPEFYKATDMLSEVSRIKNSEMVGAKHTIQHQDPLMKRVFDGYQNYLSTNNALDFDDLLQLTLRLLHEHPEIAARYQQRFEHVLVDEYQDTNNVQFDFIRQFGAVHRNIFVVGDVDQSIYSFRHANFRIILRFQQDYPDATLIKLEENYRSTGNILDAANTLIKYNRERFEKTLISTKVAGEPLHFHVAQNEDEEATYIVQQIRMQHERDSLEFGDFCILFRTNTQSRLIEQYLIRSNIPYNLVGGYKFYDRKEIKDMMSYLNFLHNPQDSLSLQRIVNVPKRGIGPKAIDIIEKGAYFEGRGLTLWQALQESAIIDQLPPKANEAIQEFRYFTQQLLKEIHPVCNLPVSVIVERIFNDSGYKAEIEAESDEKKREDRIKNIESLIQAAVEYEESSKTPMNLSGFLEQLALFSDTDRLKNEGKLVTLMTVHSAKGLEYPVVFLPGMEEGLFPHARSVIDGEHAVEEERRLMYVAITRAKRRLHLIYTANRRSKYKNMTSKLSRFMLEIAAHLRIPGDLFLKAKEEAFQRRSKTGTGNTPAPIALKMPTAGPPATSVNAAPRPGLTNSSTTAPTRPPLPPVRSTSHKLTLQPGDRVRHPKFGDGEVEKVIQTVAKIQFKGIGIKLVDISVAPLEKIS